MEKLYNSKTIFNIMVETLNSVGIKEEDSEIIASCYIEADLAGVNTHGVNVFPVHIEKFLKGTYNKHPEIKVIREGTSFQVLDGDESIGPVSASKAMNIAVEKAKETGIYVCFLKNTNTIGPAFFYNNIALKNKMIGITMSNSPAAMAPTNGKDKLIGTNPLAISIPANKEAPIIYDIATSAVAKSKIKQAMVEGKEIPLGWATDKNGIPTTNSKEAIEGLVLPMAGYKGYGLAMNIDILTGVISGANFLNYVGKFYGNDKCMNIGATFIAINPRLVLGNEFYLRIDEYIKTIKSSKKINDEITIPGERRLKNRKKALDEGIPLNDSTVKSLQNYIRKYNLNYDL